MSGPLRRRILVLGAIGLLSAGAGYSAVSERFSDDPELGRITVQNTDDAPHVVHVAVARGSELVYGSSHELEAASESLVDGIASRLR